MAGRGASVLPRSFGRSGSLPKFTASDVLVGRGGFGLADCVPKRGMSKFDEPWNQFLS